MGCQTKDTAGNKKDRIEGDPCGNVQGFVPDDEGNHVQWKLEFDFKKECENTLDGKEQTCQFTSRTHSADFWTKWSIYEYVVVVNTLLFFALGYKLVEYCRNRRKAN